MRKEGIGYLPQFDNTEHTIYKLSYIIHGKAVKVAESHIVTVL